MNEYDNHQLPSDDEFETGLRKLFSATPEDDVTYPESDEMKHFDQSQRLAYETLRTYVVGKNMISEDLVSLVQCNDVYAQARGFSSPDQNKISAFISMCDTYTVIRLNNRIAKSESTRESEMALLQSLVGDIAQIDLSDKDREVWIESIKDTILPLMTHVTSEDVEKTIEQSGILKALNDLRDLKSRQENDTRQEIKDTIITLLESAYGVHDDIGDVARAVIYAAEFRALDQPFSVRENQLQQYLDRYPLAKELADVATQLLRSKQVE